MRLRVRLRLWLRLQLWLQLQLWLWLRLRLRLPAPANLHVMTLCCAHGCDLQGAWSAALHAASRYLGHWQGSSCCFARQIWTSDSSVRFESSMEQKSPVVALKLGPKAALRADDT